MPVRSRKPLFQRVVRAEEALDAPAIARLEIANDKLRHRPVGRHLALGAVGEEEVAGEHACDEVADDDPGDELDDEAGAAVWAERFGEQPAEACADDAAGDAPEDNRDEHPPEELAFARSGFGKDVVLDIDERSKYACFRKRLRCGLGGGCVREGGSELG